MEKVKIHCTLANYGLVITIHPPTGGFSLRALVDYVSKAAGGGGRRNQEGFNLRTLVDYVSRAAIYINQRTYLSPQPPPPPPPSPPVYLGRLQT
eukprot:9577373-Ditylum_brightwellii.AAC.1